MSITSLKEKNSGSDKRPKRHQPDCIWWEVDLKEIIIIYGRKVHAGRRQQQGEKTHPIERSRRKGDSPSNNSHNSYTIQKDSMPLCKISSLLT
jgi:hypothetical protein